MDIGYISSKLNELLLNSFNHGSSKEKKRIPKDTTIFHNPTYKCTIQNFEWISKLEFHRGMMKTGNAQ